MEKVYLKGTILGELKQLGYDPKPTNVTDTLKQTEAQLSKEIEELKSQITSKRKAYYAVRLALKDRI